MGQIGPTWEVESIYGPIFVIHFHIPIILGHKIANGDKKLTKAKWSWMKNEITLKYICYQHASLSITFSRRNCVKMKTLLQCKVEKGHQRVHLQNDWYKKYKNKTPKVLQIIDPLALVSKPTRIYMTLLLFLIFYNLLCKNPQNCIIHMHMHPDRNGAKVVSFHETFILPRLKAAISSKNISRIASLDFHIWATHYDIIRYTSIS